MKEWGHVEASDFLIIPRILCIGDSTVHRESTDSLIGMTQTRCVILRCFPHCKCGILSTDYLYNMFDVLRLNKVSKINT